MLRSCQSRDDVISGLGKIAYKSGVVEVHEKLVQNDNSRSGSAFQKTNLSPAILVYLCFFMTRFIGIDYRAIFGHS